LGEQAEGMGKVICIDLLIAKLKEEVKNKLGKVKKQIQTYKVE